MMKKTGWFVAISVILSSRHAASVTIGLENESVQSVDAIAANNNMLRGGDIQYLPGEEDFSNNCSGGLNGEAPARCVVLPYSFNNGDLGVRFNKFDFTSETGMPPDHWARLTLEDYPIQGGKAQVLKRETSAGSVVTEEDHQFNYDCRQSAHEYILASGGYPTMPNSNPDHEFWAEFDEVVDWQLFRRLNADPNTLFRLPDLWKDWSISQVSESVHDEYPGSLQATFTEWLVKDKTLKLDQSIVPFRSQSDFLGKVVRSSFLNSWAVAEVGPITFFAKWAVGRPRPEEVAYLISQDTLTAADGVPEHVVQKVKSMKLESAESFTGYPEGSPKHPSWPAMHSAGSTGSFWLNIIFNLTEEQYCQALLTDYMVAMARTVSGVHYRMDNICGLNMGQQIIAERLADVLTENYGGDRAVIQAKIDKERFDWEDFDPLTCSRSPSI
jgi:PAP2 superfamily